MVCECGTGSFKHVDEDPEAVCGGGLPSPRGKMKHGGKVNPYAGRGLDQFSVVLSELEAQRTKILRRVVDSVLVRLAVQSNGGWTPVVINLPDQPPLIKGKGKKSPRVKQASSAVAPLPPPAASASITRRQPAGPGKK
ncbi:unnamed protein product [Urochloa humidicola]